jgi:ATP-dependent Clp protease ATP-binding subunit ClpA
VPDLIANAEFCIPDVGKTAIAEGLARRIIHGEVPDVLKGFG